MDQERKGKTTRPLAERRALHTKVTRTKAWGHEKYNVQE